MQSLALCLQCKATQVEAKRVRNTQTYDATHRRLRAELLRDNPNCYICDRPNANSMDHVVPVAKGGSTTLTNTIPLCKQCNDAKIHKSIAEYVHYRLLRDQYVTPCAQRQFDPFFH